MIFDKHLKKDVNKFQTFNISELDKNIYNIRPTQTLLDDAKRMKYFRAKIYNL